MEKTEHALELFTSGFNCAQAVFGPFAEDYGLSQDVALKTAGGLGGGVRCGEICGAASGAVLVIGLAHGQAQAGDAAAKALCGAETSEFMRRFTDRNKGFCTCRDLLGVDLSKLTPEESAERRSEFLPICRDLVLGSVEILEEMGY